ncbi:MAG TPA: DUF3626 domain-containing protein [Galbitalea sp.]|jgi:hypothetical protein|nr:DUF3626 domain-containing protein [Galbitalea sp.]
MKPEATLLTAAAIAAVKARSAPGPIVRAGARVALHFHPDFDLLGDPTLLKMLADGEYVSQFVTGTSNGGLTAQQGGDRWLWEHELFDGVYDNADPRHRPLYGSLQLERDPFGPSPRFGSAYFRLRQAVTERSTFTYPDSAHPPLHLGVADCMSLEKELDSRPAGSDPLDHYIEAQVHGGLNLVRDVEALVLDPSFAGSTLAAAAASANMKVEWHPGYVIDVNSIAEHPQYRGEDAVTLALRLADGRVLTPAILGRARGRSDVDPQLLKYVWHYLARFGKREAGHEGSSPAL